MRPNLNEIQHQKHCQKHRKDRIQNPSQREKAESYLNHEGLQIGPHQSRQTEQVYAVSTPEGKKIIVSTAHKPAPESKVLYTVPIGTPQGTILIPIGKPRAPKFVPPRLQRTSCLFPGAMCPQPPSIPPPAALPPPPACPASPTSTLLRSLSKLTV